MSDGRGEGWNARGYLPHLEVFGRPQFVTWRLADSLPVEAVDRLRAEPGLTNPEYVRRVEALLDQGMGSCLLKRHQAAMIVRDAILHDRGPDCQVHSWVIMPNHVHVLWTLQEPLQLGTLMKAVKGFSSKELAKTYGVAQPIWQPDYFDTLIRDSKHFEQVRAYIESNPVKAGLCLLAHQWTFSSASDVR